MSTIPSPTPHPGEPHQEGNSSRLNWLRAGVLGSNDGIVSVSALVVGVAAATSESSPVLIAGIASLAAGAISMALGEYVSVSTQRDSERSMIALERAELRDMPEEELEELTGIYQSRGLSRETAELVAKELTAHDALGAHLSAELHLDQHDLVNPWQAAAASALSFTVGGLIPLLAILLTPLDWRIAATFAAVVVALVITGWLSAWLGGSAKGKAIVRIVFGGVLALAVTYTIGALFGVAGV